MFRLVKSKGSPFLFASVMQKTTLIACDSTVAIAAPGAARPAAATKTRSPAMFAMHDTRTVTSGVFASPIPRKTLPRMLYPVMKIVPAEQMCTYETVFSNASFGVFMMAVNGRVMKTMMSVTAAESRMKKSMLVPTMSAAFSFFPAPSDCPICIVVPIASPAMMNVIVCIIIVPVATADTSAAVPNCPTTSKSTAPYNDCRKSAPRTGTAKRRSFPAIFPEVNEIFSSFSVI